MSHYVTIYGALWATSKENNVINPVSGTVSQNSLLGVVRISYGVEPIFRRYHQTMFLRSDYVCSSSKSLNHFTSRSNFSWRKNAKSNGARSSEYGVSFVLYPIVYLLSFHSSFFFRESLVSSVYLTVLYNCVVPLNMNLNVSTGIIFADTQNLMALRMSFNDVASLIFPISYHNLSANSDISNIKQTTKDHQTSKEHRHELVLMSFDVCKSLMPICLFSTNQTERSGYYRFHFFKVLCSSLLALL